MKSLNWTSSYQIQEIINTILRPFYTNHSLNESIQQAELSNIYLKNFNIIEITVIINIFQINIILQICFITCIILSV